MVGGKGGKTGWLTEADRLISELVALIWCWRFHDPFIYWNLHTFPLIHLPPDFSENVVIIYIGLREHTKHALMRYLLRWNPKIEPTRLQWDTQTRDSNVTRNNRRYLFESMRFACLMTKNWFSKVACQRYLCKQRSNTQPLRLGLVCTWMSVTHTHFPLVFKNVLALYFYHFGWLLIFMTFPY